MVIEKENKRAIVIIVIILLSPFYICCQEFRGRTVIGKKYAEEEVNKATIDKNYQPFYDTLIDNKETAIAVAEPVLFKIYGKKNITDERPYECYLINGFWYISGTLPVNSLGGTFKIIINSKNGQVIKIAHGK